MRVLLHRAYSTFAYLAFVLSFTALVFASTGLVPTLVSAVDGAPRRGFALALAIDLTLVLAFGVPHTVMARPAFKRRVARIVPLQLQRSTFVLVSAAFVFAIAWGWAPIDGDVWNLGDLPAVAFAIQGIALVGFGLAFVASFAFDHFALFGLTRGTPPTFATPTIYRVVRHPMMLGILVGIWAAPHMTIGHLVFGGLLTAYVVIGLRFEERSLLSEFGERYQQYCAEVPMLLPWPRPRRDGLAVRTSV